MVEGAEQRLCPRFFIFKVDMTELTQEELTIILLWGLDRIEAIGINDFTEEGHMDLFHKLQDMDVNYCEHETSNNGYCPGLYEKVIGDKDIMAKDLVRIYECNKCGEYYK